MPCLADTAGCRLRNSRHHIVRAPPTLRRAVAKVLAVRGPARVGDPRPTEEGRRLPPSELFRAVVL